MYSENIFQKTCVLYTQTIISVISGKYCWQQYRCKGTTKHVCIILRLSLLRARMWLIAFLDRLTFFFSCRFSVICGETRKNEKDNSLFSSQPLSSISRWLLYFHFTKSRSKRRRYMYNTSVKFHFECFVGSYCRQGFDWCVLLRRLGLT